MTAPEASFTSKPSKSRRCQRIGFLPQSTGLCRRPGERFSMYHGLVRPSGVSSSSGSGRRRLVADVVEPSSPPLSSSWNPSDDSLSSCRGRLRELVDSLSSSEQGPEQGRESVHRRDALFAASLGPSALSLDARGASLDARGCAPVGR